MKRLSLGMKRNTAELEWKLLMDFGSMKECKWQKAIVNI